MNTRMNISPGCRRAPVVSRAGLTLVEVILALAILGIGLSVMIQSVSRCLAVVHKTRNYETARYLLQRLEVEHPLGLEQPIAAGMEEGRFDEPYETFSWQREIMFAVSETDPVFQVHTRIMWVNESGGESEQATTTLVFKPEYAQRGEVRVRR